MDNRNSNTTETGKDVNGNNLLPRLPGVDTNGSIMRINLPPSSNGYNSNAASIIANPYDA